MADRTVIVKGPKGELSARPARRSSVRQDGDTLVVERPDDERQNRAQHGLTRTLVANMVTGVTEGFTKELEIHGVGYRANAQGPATSSWPSASATRCGSRPRGHRVRGIAAADQASDRGEGIDKEKVGQVAADIRKIRKPEPYKGKGVRYAGEHIQRKAGKTGK